MKTLYRPSFIDKNGLRTMLGPNQGRHMFATRGEAERWLASALSPDGPNSPDKLVLICGEQSRGTFRVDAFECYDHGDAVSIYVDEEKTASSEGGDA